MGWKSRIKERIAAVPGDSDAPNRAGDPSSPAAAGRPGGRRNSSIGSGRAKGAAVRPPAHPEVDRLLRRPVFVLSPVRSGSTLVRYILGAHSQIHAPHELHLRRVAVQFNTKLARNAMDVLGLNQADLEHLLWDRVLHRELVLSGRQVVVDKTPSNVFIHRRLATAWPDARFIFLMRHPASIASSWAEASVGRRTEEESVLDALRYMEALQRARTELPGLTVRYEDLTASPEAEARRMCDFLELPYEPGMLNYGDEGVFDKGLGDWTDKIRSGQVQRGRELPSPEDVPAPLLDVSRLWGYLT